MRSLISVTGYSISPDSTHCVPFRAYFSSLGLNFLICQWTDNLWIREAIFVTTLRNRNCKRIYRLGQKQCRGATYDIWTLWMWGRPGFGKSWLRASNRDKRLNVGWSKSSRVYFHWLYSEGGFAWEREEVEMQESTRLACWPCYCTVLTKTLELGGSSCFQCRDEAFKMHRDSHVEDHTLSTVWTPFLHHVASPHVWRAEKQQKRKSGPWWGDFCGTLWEK